MRIYLPATLSEIERHDGQLLDLAPRTVHAVTSALRQVLPDEDEEGLEYAAHLAAADDSLVRIAADPSAAHQRLVITVDAPDGSMASPDVGGSVSTVVLTAPVAWSYVACLHVDEPEAVPDVEAAMRGDVDAVDRLSERSLLWYDVSEVDELPR